MLHLRRVGGKPTILSLAVLGLALLLPARSQGQTFGGFTADDSGGHSATFYFLDSNLDSLLLTNTSSSANLTGIYFDSSKTALSGPADWAASSATSPLTSSLESLLSTPDAGVAAGGGTLNGFTLASKYQSGSFDFKFSDGTVLQDVPAPPVPMPEIPGAAMACFLLGTVPLVVRLKRNKSRQEA